MTTVHETCRVPPPPCAAAELSLPLSFSDIIWLHFHPIRRLIFYDHPCSELEFLTTIVPKLKQSLSLTLKHFLPVAANLLRPSDTDKNKPLIRYVSGDSVPLTIAVSSCDFDELTGYHARESDQFYDFMPKMPPSRDEGEYKLASPSHLPAGNAVSRPWDLHRFIQSSLPRRREIRRRIYAAWAEINKCGGDAEFLSRNGESLPFFDRSVFGEDSSTINTMFWNAMKNIPSKPQSFPLPTNRVRASFTLNQSHIKKLKNLVLSYNSALLHVSSFVVTAAYVWSCLVKSGHTIGEEVGESETEVFLFSADGRGRPNAMVDPPVPVNSFGNCLGFGLVAIEHKKLAADDGFLIAAEAIDDHIKNRVNNKDEFLNFPDNWRPERSKFVGLRSLGVSGSPKFDLLKTDFGWGNATKLEVLSMDGEKYTMAMCNSTDCDGGLVVGLSLLKKRMLAFATIFDDGLKLP